MKTILTAAIVMASSIAVPSVAMAQRAPAAVVVVVDTSRIYRDCNACRTAQTQLQAQLTTARTREQTLTNELRTEAQAIQTALNALAGKQPDAALQTRAEAFQRRQEAAQAEVARLQQNIQSIQANVVRQIDARLNPAITQVMTSKGANLAVDVNATLAHAPAVNVTNEVLAALNTALPSVSVTPMPQQQQPAAQPSR